MSWAERKAREAEACGDTHAVAYWLHIKATVDKAPPLSEAQKAKLRILLRPAPVTADPMPLRAAA